MNTYNLCELIELLGVFLKLSKSVEETRNRLGNHVVHMHVFETAFRADSVNLSLNMSEK